MNNKKSPKIIIATTIQLLLVVFWLCLWKVPQVYNFVNQYGWIKIGSIVLFILTILLTIENKPSSR